MYTYNFKDQSMWYIILYDYNNTKNSNNRI